ncbi:type IV toxin-antitoxin system AbiEi family antitoxin domain-containing protein [Patescibacteria group bacterium]|nr:type IV toxin-antitoxin system AbiEi family antitoxin domain-containing protein [Patescibacteria group bacterium]
MDKYNILLKQNKKTFHASDLALLWGITNKDTLNMTLKRFVDRGVLKRIHKGFYSTTDISDIDPYDLGFSYLNSYSYVSLETVLAKEGIIFQEVKYITFVSSRSSKFNIGGVKYSSRQLKEEFLNNTAGVQKVGDHFEANLERAVADILYYNPKYHFDNREIIDFDKVKKIQTEVGYVKD